MSDNKKPEDKNSVKKAAASKKSSELPAGVAETAGNTGNESQQNQKALQALFVILLILVVSFGGGWLGANANLDTSEEAKRETQRVVLDQQSDLISSIASEVGQSVVSINVTSQSSTGGLGLFGQPRSLEQSSAGTGIVLSEDGLVITNRHVVPAGTTNISLILSDGTEIDDVEIVGRTSENDSLDVAFLQITDTKGHKLVPAKLGKSSDMRVGSSVVAIGNALGQFQNTVTSGIISGYGRNVQASSQSGSGGENLNDLFQTDASINQGNSGGPLVNMRGEVIGINTAVAGGAENIGFAIPIDNIEGLIRQVSKTGKLERPYLGVVYVSLTDSIAKELDLPKNRGAYIPKSDEYGRETVVKDGPAQKAGIKEGDIIVKVGDKKIDDRNSLASLLGAYQPGDKVKFTVYRDGKERVIEVELGTMPSTIGDQ